MNTYMTVKKADLFSIGLNCIMSTVESSHALTVAIVMESDNIKAINTVGKRVHKSKEAAIAYMKENNEAVFSALNDELQLRREQGI